MPKLNMAEFWMKARTVAMSAIRSMIRFPHLLSGISIMGLGPTDNIHSTTTEGNGQPEFLSLVCDMSGPIHT